MIYGYDNLITIILMLSAIIIVSIANYQIQAAYQKYSKIASKKKLAGSDVAHEILNNNDLSEINVVAINGTLTDNYDPTKKVLHLSKDIFEEETVASIAVAAHECGHALQDKEGYSFMRLRSSLVPIVNGISYLGYFAIVAGALFGITGYIMIGIMTLFATLVFQLVTLPVEFDASKRAQKELIRLGLITEEEQAYTKDMLKWAAFTYVAGTLSTLLNLVRLMNIRGRND